MTRIADSPVYIQTSSESVPCPPPGSEKSRAERQLAHRLRGPAPTVASASSACRVSGTGKRISTLAE
jgi:hypothetical protein